MQTDETLEINKILFEVIAKVYMWFFVTSNFDRKSFNRLLDLVKQKTKKTK